MLFSSRPVNTIFSLSIMRSFLEGWSHFFFFAMEITPQKESIASTRTSVFLQKTDFRLLPSRPPGRIRVTAGSRPVVAGRLSLREVRYQLAMLRRKRNRHRSKSVRPTTLAPPVHQIALKFLKMPYISSDRGPIIVFSHWMTLFCCLFKLEWFDLADEDWCLIARWYPSHNCDTSSPHFFNLSGRESASKSINRHLNIATGRLATTCATMYNTIVSSNTVSLHTSRQEHQ